MGIPAPIAALLTLWPTLPQALGQDWPPLYWRLLDLLRRFEAADDEARAWLEVDLLRQLRQLPGGADALRRVRQGKLRQTRNGQLEWASVGAPPVEGALPDAAGLAAQLEGLLHPPDVTRYTDVYAPPRVVVGRRFPIIVGLTRAPTDGGMETTAIQAELNQLIRVVLTPRGPELLDERAKTLRVESGDSEPVVFYLRAVRSGTQSVLIDFCSQSDLLATVVHTLTAAEAGEVAPPGKVAAQALHWGDYRAPFPDLVLRICTEGLKLTYRLYYRDIDERIIDGPPLRTDPEQYRYQIMHKIENLARGLDVDGLPLTAAPDEPLTVADLERGLEKIGQQLYSDLFNEAMRREYREHITGRVHTLEIVSDEPWIPWELIKPYGDSVDGDDFLCLEYDLGRWVSGGAPPAAEIQADSLAGVAPTDSGLDQAQKELAFVRELAARLALVDRSPDEARRDRVEALLAGDAPVKLWHFACHGDFDEEAPGNSPLILQHKRRLRPNDLVGRAQSRLRRDRPLVFLNACRAGQGGLSLTGLGGWAASLVGRCHVGALIAPLWSVGDGAARHFAQVFYQAVQEPGTTLAQAMRRARCETRDAYPSDVAHLAYSLYAHPNGRFQFVPWNEGQR